jgi:hypothetical protein
MTLRAGSILQLSGLYKDKMCVAVLGWGADFAAYIQSREDQISAELVARHGDKLSEEVGRALFPELVDYGYRL